MAVLIQSDLEFVRRKFTRSGPVGLESSTNEKDSFRKMLPQLVNSLLCGHPEKENDSPADQVPDVMCFERCLRSNW